MKTNVDNIVGGVVATVVSHTNLSVKTKQFIVDTIPAAGESCCSSYKQYDAELLDGILSSDDKGVLTDEDAVIIDCIRKEYDFLEISVEVEL